MQKLKCNAKIQMRKLKCENKIFEMRNLFVMRNSVVYRSNSFPHTGTSHWLQQKSSCMRIPVETLQISWSYQDTLLRQSGHMSIY